MTQPGVDATHERTAGLENALRRLAEQEKRLAEAQRIAHLGSWDWNVVTGELVWSDEVYRIFGLTLQSFGATYEAFLHSVHVEDRDRVRGAVDRALEEGEPYAVDHRVVHPDGEIRRVHEQGEVTFDSDGKPLRMIGTVQDVTEHHRVEQALRKSEERFRAQYKGNPIPIYTWQRREDGDFTLIEYNDAAIEATEGNVARLVGRRMSELYGDSGEIPESMRRCYDEKTPLEDELWYAYRATEKRRRLKITYVYVPTDLVMVHTLDVTEERRAQETLRSSLSKKETLLREIHHRIKNNLQVIASLLYLQGRGIHDPKAREIYENSRRRVRTMALVHEQLNQSADLRGVRFGDYLRRLVASLQGSLQPESEKVSVVVDAEDVFLDVEHAVPCGLIVNELITNALKHAFAAGAAGHLGVRLRHRPGARIEVRVSDDGVGLPGDTNMDDPQSLGLQLVGNLTRQLHGALEVESNGGTTVTVTFPVTPSQDG